MNLKIINATLPGKTNYWNIAIDNGRISKITPAQSLKEEYAWGITLQLAVFAQEGITDRSATTSLLKVLFYLLYFYEQ